MKAQFPQLSKYCLLRLPYLLLFYQIKLYVLFWKVFKVQDSSAVGQESQKVAESILSFFPGFEAFTLPSPTVDPEALKSITENKSLINPLFISGLEDFRSLVRRILLPKNSINDGELVTGEGNGRFCATFVTLYSSTQTVTSC